jgi:hypothetical protein
MAKADHIHSRKKIDELERCRHGAISAGTAKVSRLNGNELC